MTPPADFAGSEAEQRGNDKRSQQESEDEGVEDEDDGGGVPAVVEGKEGAQAVVVGVVEQEMAEQAQEGEEVKERPVDGCGGERAVERDVVVLEPR
jgi:hypothetical protein